MEQQSVLEGNCVMQVPTPPGQALDAHPGNVSICHWPLIVLSLPRLADIAAIMTSRSSALPSDGSCVGQFWHSASASILYSIKMQAVCSVSHITHNRPCLQFPFNSTETVRSVTTSCDLLPQHS